MLRSVAHVSNRERTAHVLRRLSMGAQPDLIDGLSSTDAAVAKALDLSGKSPVPPAMTAPASYRAAQPTEIVPLIGWWLDQMRSPSRLIEERLVWFWHDHFATSLAGRWSSRAVAGVAFAWAIFGAAAALVGRGSE